jgi:hypothetical protein
MRASPRVKIDEALPVGAEAGPLDEMQIGMT